MQKPTASNKCDLCNKAGENLSLLSANHKELGWIKICRQCWSKLYKENSMVSSGSSSKTSSSSPCSSCPSSGSCHF